MKRIISVIFIFVLALSLAACKTDSGASPPTISPADPSGGRQEGAQAPLEPEVSKEQELLDFKSTHIEAADYELAELLRLVRPFNVCPEEFDDASELSDTALFFAAVTALSSEFIPIEDGYSYSLPIQELAPAIKSIFGPGAALSESWQSGSYEPYTVDSANGLVLNYSLGEISGLDFPYACIKTAEGWELWLLDLYDPIFADVNPAIIESGDASAVKWDMVKPYAERMQTGIYTIKTAENGSYYLAGFHYRNFKDVAHYFY